MVKMMDKKKETISFYKYILDPLGYTVIPKTTKKPKDISWKPKAEDIKEYNEMDSLKIESKIQDLKSIVAGMQKDLIEIKQRVIEYMNRQEPNDLTKPLYTGTYARNAVSRSGVVIESQALNEANNLINYLTELKMVKFKEELISRLHKENEAIMTAEVSNELGTPILKITMQ